MVLLITGATGFLGEYLLEVLDDFDLRILTRSPQKLSGSGHEVIKADITEDIDPNLFDDVTIFIHSAAKVGSWPPHREAGYEQTNIEATESLITGAISAEVERIIYTSSYFALGSTGDAICDETWDNPPDFDHPYVTTKYDAGKIVDTLAQEYPITQLHPTVVMGAGIDNPISDALIDYINGRLPGLPGGGHNRMNLVTVSDVAKAHRLAIDRNLEGKYVVGGQNMELIEFIRMFSQRLDIKEPRGLPYWMASLYGKILELIGEPSLTKADVEVAKRNWQYDSSKIRHYGYEPVPVESVIDEMLRDFLNRGVLSKKGIRRVTSYLGED